MRDLEDERPSDTRRYRMLAIVAGILLLAIGSLIYLQRHDVGGPSATSGATDSDSETGEATATPSPGMPVDVCDFRAVKCSVLAIDAQFLMRSFPSALAVPIS